MDNEFEVALWVSQHPRILNLAKEIQSAKSTPINEESHESHVNLSYSSNSSTVVLPELDDQVIYEKCELHKDFYLLIILLNLA